MQGFQKLKYVDFSTSYSITGSFLRSFILLRRYPKNRSWSVYLLRLSLYICFLALFCLNMKNFIFQKPWKLQQREFAWGLNFKGLHASERGLNPNTFTILRLFLNHTLWSAYFYVQMEIARLLTEIIAGDFKSLVHLVGA